MGPPGGGRNFVTQRFLRHLHCVSINEFDDATNIKIFSRVFDWHFGRQPFDSSVVQLGPGMVAATAAVYAGAIANLLPTPAKSHYLFNLRDFARVAGGVMMANPAGVPDADAMRRLWVHEVYRVFYDRLVFDEDRAWLFGFVREQAEKHLACKFDVVFGNLDANKDGRVEDSDMRGLVFCDFENPKAESKQYQAVMSQDALRATAESALEEFNNVSKKRMDLVLFQFAVEHVTRITRVLRQPRTHALLVGVGGSGRQSLTRLAAHINDCPLFQVEMSKSYGTTEWREDIKKIVRKAGEGGEPVVFLFPDTQIKEPSFLEDIGNLLNSGEVPNLFPLDEKVEIVEKMRNVDKQLPRHRKTDGSPTQLFALFVSRVRDFLHIVLAMSPIGDAFRNNLRQFPSIVNCCTINWFQAWPADALQVVAQRFLEDVEMLPPLRAACVRMCQVFHESVRTLSDRFLRELRRHNYVTPTSYLELINTFKTLLDARRSAVMKLKV
jgi:dynein heavy chain